MGVVDSRGSEPWVVGVHGYKRASWVMVLQQSGLICLGVSVWVSGGPLPYQCWPCPSRSVSHPIASLFSPAPILFSLALFHPLLVASSLDGSVRARPRRCPPPTGWLRLVYTRGGPVQVTTTLLSSLATLLISICKPHNVTITQACIFLSHIPMATRGHSVKYP